MSTIPVEQALQIAGEHHQAGQFDEAEAIYRKVLERQPNHPVALHRLGMLAGQAGRPEAAVQLIAQAIAINPGVAEYHINIGECHRRLGRLDEAIASLRMAIGINPNHAGAYDNLGQAWFDKGELDQAIACFRRGLEIKPDFVEVYYKLGNACKDNGQVDEAMASYRRALELNPGFRTAHDSLLCLLHYDPACDAAKVFAESRKWNHRHAEPLGQFIQPHANDREPERRLRIGYVSADFYEHASVLFLLPLFGHHDRQQFEVTCYADLPHADTATTQLRDQVQHWRNIAGVSDAQAAAMIRQDKIDILVDLKVHTAGNRLLIFAHKPAPIQVTWLGYPGTTGLKTIDYRLTDPYLDPPGLDEAFYSEQSIRLPNTFWGYDPLSTEPVAGALPADGNGFITFGSLNHLCKINRPVLSLWAGILRMTAHSRLLLLAGKGSSRQRVLEGLAAQGIAAERVQFLPIQPRGKYLRTYHRMDIGLDTWPCNGHTTSLDSFWMGVPVITMAGRTAMGRAGASHLTNLGLGELIAHNPDEYVHLVTALAADLPRLRELRATLRQRMENSPLMDAAGFARDIESAYRAMWRRWCR